jgi:hypothetical protein
MMRTDTVHPDSLARTRWHADTRQGSRQWRLLPASPPRRNAPPFFRRIKAPDKTELEVLVQRISQRVGRCLERQGLLVRDNGSDYLNLPLPEDHDPMAQLIGSSVNYRIAVGPQQGKKAFW